MTVTSFSRSFSHAHGRRDDDQRLVAVLQRGGDLPETPDHREIAVSHIRVEIEKDENRRFDIPDDPVESGERVAGLRIGPSG
ncbi:MAG: hypothetical protein V8T86_12320 [Victivallis sp.]